MERKFQILLDKLLKQIFIKRMTDPAERGPEAPAVVAFVFSLSARQPRSPGHDGPPEYFARLRQKMRLCFKQEKEVVHASEPGESFEKRLKIEEVESCLEELILLEYDERPLSEKIARVEELQEIYRKMVNSRQSGY